MSYGFVGLSSKIKTAYNGIRAMRALIPLMGLVLVVILAGSSPSAVSDNDTSPTGNDISNQEVTTSPTEASNPSTSAAITITMTGVRDE